MRQPDKTHAARLGIITVKATLTAALPALALLLAACATTSPQSESALAQAQSAVSTLETDPLAAQTAGKPLQDARDALAAAEKAEQDHKPPDEVVHLAYLARRQAEIGEAVLAERRAQQQIAEAQTRRDQILMAARERDAAASREQAMSAQAQAQSAQAQAQAAQSQAAQARDQVAAANDAAEEAGERRVAL